MVATRNTTKRRDVSTTMEDWRKSRLEELVKKEQTTIDISMETTTRNGNMNELKKETATSNMNRKKKSRIHCSAINCKHYVATHPELAFHRFPKDPERCSKWLQILGNSNLADISLERLNECYRVCSAHFHPSQYKRAVDVHAGLNWDAVPSRGDPPNPPFPLDSESQRKKPILHQELPPKTTMCPDSPPPLDSGSGLKPSMECQELPPKSSKKSCDAHQSSTVDSYTTDHDQKPTLSETKSVPDNVIVITGHPTPRISPLLKISQSPLLRPLPMMLQMRPLQTTSQTPLPMSNASQPKTSEPEPESAAREIALKRKIRNLQSQVSKLKTKVRELKGLKKSTTVAITKKSVLQLMKKLLPATAYKFFRSQLNVAQRKSHGFRWTEQDKAFFLDLLHANPLCYRMMKNIFFMPSIRTLRRLMKPPGLDKNILTTTEFEETMQPVDEVCTAITELQSTTFL